MRSYAHLRRQPVRVALGRGVEAQLQRIVPVCCIPAAVQQRRQPVRLVQQPNICALHSRYGTMAWQQDIGRKGSGLMSDGCHLQHRSHGMVLPFIYLQCICILIGRSQCGPAFQIELLLIHVRSQQQEDTLRRATSLLSCVCWSQG
jgi:hypothetical protein